MSQPIPAVKTLVLVFSFLLVMTGTTIGVAYLELGPFNVVVAVLIAVIKACAVVWFFMNIRHSTTLNRLFVAAGLVWLSILLLLTFSDYLTRHWSYQPKPWE